MPARSTRFRKRIVSGARSGFSLVELLVVVGIVAVLISILAPALGSARHSARATADLANMRSLEQTHQAYMTAHKGTMLGTSHGVSWTDVLREFNNGLLMRSPLDQSPHFPGGEPVDGQFRETSYSINFLLSPDNEDGVSQISLVPAPSSTIHFVFAAFTGAAAVADHVHPNLWWSPLGPSEIPGRASSEMQINVVRGEPFAWIALGNYGFLDGHAETLRFEQTYTDRESNQFDPDVAR